MSHLLEVRDLEVKFALRFGDITAIDGVSFTLDKGEKLGLVGESGAGKSVTGFSIINLISKPGYIAKGNIRFEGNKISTYSDEQMRPMSPSGSGCTARLGLTERPPVPASS